MPRCTAAVIATLALGIAAFVPGGGGPAAGAPPRPAPVPAAAPPPTGAAPGRVPTPAMAVEWRRDILPLFEKRCFSCHGPMKGNGGLRMHKPSALARGGITGKALRPGDAKGSYLMARLRGEGGEDRMPLEAPPLSPDELALVARWIDAGAVMPPDEAIAFHPSPAGLKRLTRGQYATSVRALLGDAAPLPKQFEPDTLISGSAVIAAARMPLSLRLTEQLTSAAEGLARAAVGDEAWRAEWLAGCAHQATPRRHPFDPATRECGASFFRRFARRAWRRPPTAEESARYDRLFNASAVQGPLRGIEALVAAVLQSPHFLYRSELGVADPQDPARRVLTPFELAARLSFFLTGAPPDEPLLDAAESGRLTDDEGLRAEAERLLGTPRARENMRGFFSELLRLGRLDRLHQFRSKYAHATDTLGPAMREETLRLFEEVAFGEGRDFREIFDTRVTHVNGELARLYGLPVLGNEMGWSRVELPATTPRAGLLGHASFLALNAHPTSSSPSRRGKFIREALLCQAVAPPPPGVSTRLPEESEDGKPRTTRQMLATHRASPQCAGCHKAMDPMGLALESFDGLGAFRTSENGLPIDTTGELDGVPFKDAAELGALLRKSDKVAVCIARHLFRFALGHLESEGEEPLMEELARGIAKDGYRFPSLVLAVVKSRGFRYVSAN